MARILKKPPNKAKATSTSSETISFEYIKSSLFRVVHADGAIGSMTPSGNLHIAFYSERPAIPQMTVHEHRPDGSIGESIPDKMKSKDTIVRELDVDIVFSGDVVDSLIEFLQKHKDALSSPPKTSNAKKKTRNVAH